MPIIVEVGGRRGYMSSAERRRQERRRNAMQLLGKTIYFFTCEDVKHDPAYVLDTIHAGAPNRRLVRMSCPLPIPEGAMSRSAGDAESACARI